MQAMLSSRAAVRDALGSVWQAEQVLKKAQPSRPVSTETWRRSDVVGDDLFVESS